MLYPLSYEGRLALSRDTKLLDGHVTATEVGGRA
jgi:hypothetical protein